MWVEKRYHSLLFCACLKWRQDLISLQSHVWCLCMSPCLPNMSGLDSLASVQGPYARSKRLCEALIRVRDGQSCLFLFLLPYMVQANWWMSWQLHSFFFFLSCQPDSRPGDKISVGRLSICLAGERMGTSSEDAMTFRPFLTVGAVRLDAPPAPPFFQLLFVCFEWIRNNLIQSTCMLSRVKGKSV